LFLYLIIELRDVWESEDIVPYILNLSNSR